MNILLKSAKISAPSNPSIHQKKRDILIKNGTIEKIAMNIALPGNTKEIELDNLHISIGWFDTSVSYGEPGYEERETISDGLKVAAKSGFTDILLNPNTNPLPDSGSDIIFLKDRANGSTTNLHPIGALTVNSECKALAELYDMQTMGAVGFYDYKKALSNSNLLKIALLYTQNFNGLVFSYPEDVAISGKGIVNEGEVSTRLGLKGIPALSEELQIARDLFILGYTGGKLHIPTISSAGAVKLIADAKKKGLDVTTSVSIHNLCLTDSELETFDTNYKVKPPLRTKKDSNALLKGLQNGTIDFVTSDHRPMDIEEKRMEFDNAQYGSIGLESAFGALHNLLGLDETISLLSKGRERFGIPTPTIEQGAIANLTLFNPNSTYSFKEEHILSKSKNAIFLDQEMKGSVYGIINKGKIHLND
ncbi:dihydroorotase [Croceitalea rosinachiae]|uniref:Dihydroorotase n=1 Tax=Croceitalea rosinachiae TaxID=3075596 RepID=A0ABU3AE96_9FLAO|nr:dihydroorotase [Croceitalea sp. F388]MDT0607423.1 dihydroorotase [Croceitalea sp. F388]